MRRGKTLLGRLATQIADVLRGKRKPTYTPHIDTGDFVIVVNADKIAVTGNKRADKLYHRHSGYPGGLRTRTLEQMLALRPEEVIRLAVKGMMPRNRLAGTTDEAQGLRGPGASPRRTAARRRWRFEPDAQTTPTRRRSRTRSGRAEAAAAGGTAAGRRRRARGDRAARARGARTCRRRSGARCQAAPAAAAEAAPQAEEVEAEDEEEEPPAPRERPAVPGSRSRGGHRPGGRRSACDGATVDPYAEYEHRGARRGGRRSSKTPSRRARSRRWDRPCRRRALQRDGQAQERIARVTLRPGAGPTRSTAARSRSTSRARRCSATFASRSRPSATRSAWT